MLEKLFHLKQNHTNVRTELVAGLTTFMTMAYILAVNPSILGAAGMDVTAVMLATCLASFIGSLCMGLMANLPFALSAGMGINAYMAYTVVLTYGYTWQTALLTVFIEGVIFIALSNFGIREKIFDSIPLSLKHGVSVGIGIFIAFIGMQNAGIIVSSSTLISVFDFQTAFHTAGISALLAIIGTFLTAVLYIRKVPGAILLGILATWAIGMLCQLTGLYVPDAAAGYYSLFPSFTLTDFSKLGETFGQCFHVDLHHVGVFNFIVVIISFLFVDIFDTLGALIGVATKADMLDENGRVPGLRPALLADAIVRLVPGALTDETSALSDSFQDGLLSPPVYTRPAEFNGWKVPDVLLSGNPKLIDNWQDEQALERTKRLRPELLNKNF